MKSIIHSRGFLLATAIFMGSLARAQEASSTAAPMSPASTDNSMMYTLIAIALLLVVAIAVLGQVLIRLTIYAYDHREKVAKTLILVLMMSLAGVSAMAQAGPAAAPAAPMAVKQASEIFSMDYIVAISVILLEALVIGIMLRRIWLLIEQINPKPATVSTMHFELPRWFDRFNQSVAIEHEKDIMLDHDYDGIRELDNALPPWWKYGFALSIVWAIGYFSYYHVFAAAPLSAGEYTNEMEAARISKEAYMRTAKNNVDENTIVFDAGLVADGQKIFMDNCVACHGSKGEGGVGPNLTDDYWLHGGKINDIFKTVKYGWPANGMKSWQSDFSSMQIAQVVCYVKSIKGTNPPNPKPAQGDMYTDANSAAKKVSTAGKVDSLTAVVSK